ncbi:MAG TPA: hypothetical protein VFQ37_01895 [Mycobacterium sp.]|nr:hypothetical protein [Mycobacterium sp.]
MTATAGTAAAAPVLVSDVDAAVSATSGNAAADSVSALGADPVSDWNMAISIDGINLFHIGDATATSGFGDLAIAFGDGSSASATGGFMDFAVAGGSNSTATATGSLEAADVIGNSSKATSEGIGGVAFTYGANSTATTDNFMNFASVVGNNSDANTGGDCSTAYVFGDGSTATAGLSASDHIDWAVALGNGFDVTAAGSWLADNIDGIQFFGL